MQMILLNDGFIKAGVQTIDLNVKWSLQTCSLVWGAICSPLITHVLGQHL